MQKEIGRNIYFFENTHALAQTEVTLYAPPPPIHGRGMKTDREHDTFQQNEQR